MSLPFVHLFVRATNARADVWLNGFPIVELLPVGPAKSTGQPVNPLLVGENNELRVTLSPVPNVEQAPLAAVELEAKVRLFAATDVWADPDSGEPLVDVTVDDALREQARSETVELPLSLLPGRFDSSGPSFRWRLLEAEAVTDREQVIAYALELRDIFGARDADALAEQIAPKLADYAVAYDTSEAGLHERLRTYLREKVFVRGVVVDFEADDIGVFPCCDGRLWHLRRKPPPHDPHAAPADPSSEVVGTKPTDWDPFMRTHADAAGLESMLEIFVGFDDGELRIVR